MINPTIAANIAKTQVEYLEEAWSRAEEGFDTYHDAAEHATDHTVGFIVRHTSGVICCSVPGARIDELELPPMYVNNEDPKGTAFTVSVDLKHGTTTGISAADRAATFRALAAPATTAADFCRPGHVFPLRPRAGGVLERSIYYLRIHHLDALSAVGRGRRMR